MKSSMTLNEFNSQLKQRMYVCNLRPFVCRGSPFDCRLFIVGFNPGTALPFKPYWQEAGEFNKDQFLADYRVLHGGHLRGARRAIETIARIAGPTVLDMNIYAYPTKTIQEFKKLRPTHERTEIFEFLMDCLYPQVVLVHGKESIAIFSQLYQTQLDRSGAVRQVVVNNRPLKVLGVPHLAEYGIDAKGLGNLLATLLE